jgi:hypothetical protein
MISDRKETAPDGGTGKRSHLPLGQQNALEECRFIDIRDWKRRGLIRDGSGFSWSWSQDGVKKASIQVSTASDFVRVAYSFRRSGDAWQPIAETIWLSKTACNLGGERLWFCCPGCGRRAAKLYLYAPRFRCRDCLGLPYASQQETVLDRASRKARKLRRKLGDDGGIGDPIWKKPKGMHWRTFEKLKAKVDKQDDIANFAFICRASKMIGWNWPL